MTIDDLKTRGRRFIAKNRQHAPVRALHRLASFIEEAYENDEWDMSANGETALIRRLAPAQFKTVFDVGAHVGGWSTEALRFWPGARAHLFEVAPPTFERLKRDIGLAARATLNPFGLSDAAGAREMFFFPEHPHLTCDMPRHAFAATPFTARLLDGDTYLDEHGIHTIDFMKVDVEGAEHLVFKGFSRAIREGRIHGMQFEYGAFSIQTRVLLADYYEMLSRDYWIGKIFPSGIEFRDYDWTMENFRFSNFACVSRRRPDLRDLAEGCPPRLAHAS
jgi:FkbM family methyltransferase